jgi:acyl dehydratase
MVAKAEGNICQDTLIVKREDLALFGDIISDNNPIHRDVSQARAVGFEDTPVYAVLLAARLEQEFLKSSNHSRGIKMSFKFSKPVYPGQEIFFSSTNNNSSTKIIANVNGQCAVSADFQSFEGEFYPMSNSTMINSSNLSVNPSNVNEFYRLIGIKPASLPSYVHIASSIPANLLNYLKKNGARLNGISRELEIFPVGHKIGLEDVVAESFLSNQPRGNQERGFVYLFDSKCYQGRSVSLIGKMKVIHPDLIV